MKKKCMVLFLSLSMVLTLFVGCSDSKDSEKQLQKVTLNEVAHSIFYAPMYVAIEKDYFKDEGIDLELVTGFGADKTMTAVLSNEADIGFMGPETTVYTYNEGANDKIVNFCTAHPACRQLLSCKGRNAGFSLGRFKRQRESPWWSVR